MKRLPLVLLTVLLVSGCATNEFIAMSQTELRTSKAFTPPNDGTGNLYIYRNECCGIGISLRSTIYIDGLRAGVVDYRTFIVRNLSAGQHDVIFDVGEIVPYKVTVEPNTNQYLNYFRQKVTQVKRGEAEKAISGLAGLN